MMAQSCNAVFEMFEGIFFGICKPDIDNTLEEQIIKLPKAALY